MSIATPLSVSGRFIVDAKGSRVRLAGVNWFGAHEDLGVVTGLFPTKGMSLPFISAGLSNLLLMGLLIGILINTQRRWGRASLPHGAGAMREVLA